MPTFLSYFLNTSIGDMEKEKEKLKGEGKIEDVQNSSRFSSDTSRVQRERWRSVIVEMVGVVCVWEAAPKRARPQVDGCQLALGTATVHEILWRGTRIRTTWKVAPLGFPLPSLPQPKEGTETVNLQLQWGNRASTRRWWNTSGIQRPPTLESSPG